MVRDERRRQKKIMKKIKKDKIRKEKLKKASGLFPTNPKTLLANTRQYPIFSCMINKAWKAQGLAHILIAREQPNKMLLWGVYLVDIFCLGLKSSFFNVNYTPDDYYKLKSSFIREQNSINCPVQLAHQIIYGAIDYADKLGFKPEADFNMTGLILEERGNIEPNPTLEFGKNGQPYFIAGPDDDVKAIMAQLRKSVGEGNFTFIAPMDNIADEEIFEAVKEDDDEFIDDEFDYDEYVDDDSNDNDL